MKVTSSTVVSLRYLMKNEAGEILEDRMHSAPVQYLHGSGNILPSLEACLEGLETGEEKTIAISGETDAALNGQFNFEIIIDAVRHATTDEIKAGKPAEPATVKDCGPGCCC